MTIIFVRNSLCVLKIRTSIIFLLITNYPFKRVKYLLFSIFECLSTHDEILSSGRNSIAMITEIVVGCFVNKTGLMQCFDEDCSVFDFISYFNIHL